MKTLFKSLLIVLAPFAVGCGGPIFYVDVDEPAICKTVRDVPFEPAVPGADLRLTFDLPVGQYLPLIGTQDARTTLYLNELSFTAKEGIQDFNTVDAATISVLPRPESTASKQVLLSYTKDPANPPNKVLVVGGERDVELQPYLSADEDRSASLEAVMKGALPSNYWTADVKVCIHAHVRYNYGRPFGL
jgi:hypothetical protein